MFVIDHRLRRLLLWFGVVAPLLRHAMIYGLGAATPHYSASTDFISELGALDAPYSIQMNSLGIGAIGAMMLLASTALLQCLAPFAGGRTSALLLALSGLAFVLVALSPCDPGCVVSEPLNSRMIVHLFSGFIAMGAEVAAPLALGLLHFRRKPSSVVGWLALALGIIGVAAYLLLLGWATRLTHPGLVQRIVQAVGDGWLFAVSIYCLRRWPAV